MKEKDQKKRRDLIAMGLIAGTGALAGSQLPKLLADGSEEKVKLITASGQLVEVDARHLPGGMRRKPISNASLKDWVDNDKTQKKNGSDGKQTQG